MENSLRNLQIQKMTPQAIHSLQLMTMPLGALLSYVGRCTSENPFVEMNYDWMERSAGIAARERWSLSLDETYAAAPQGESLYDFLTAQIRLSGLKGRRLEAARLIAANISRAGYLELDLSAAAGLLGMDEEKMLDVLRLVQSMGPPGVGARDLGECLSLQLGEDAPGGETARALVKNDLEALAAHRFTALSRKYKLDPRRLQELLDHIRTLDPRPGSRFSAGESVNYILPDAVVENDGGELSVSVRGRAESIVRFDGEYMSGTDDEEARAFLDERRTEAVRLIDSIELRYCALERLVGYIAEKQAPFFTGRHKFPRPLTQREAAADLGISPSTVSRCVKDKYISSPCGTFPLGFFFSGNSTTGGYSKKLLRELIESEPPRAPYSDARLSELLEEQGIELSRRCVAKYRAEMGIGTQNQRMRFD